MSEEICSECECAISFDTEGELIGDCNNIFCPNTGWASSDAPVPLDFHEHYEEREYLPDTLIEVDDADNY